MLPWITTRPLEQANDTKELNQVQLPMLARAKLVDNSVHDSGVVGWIVEPGPPRCLTAVDASPGRHHGSTGSQRVFLHQALTDRGPNRRFPPGALSKTRLPQPAELRRNSGPLTVSEMLGVLTFLTRTMLPTILRDTPMR